MKKRFIPLIFCLALLLSAGAASAAGAQTEGLLVLGSDGDVTAAVRTRAGVRELVYTTDGVHWSPCELEGDAAWVQNLRFGDYNGSEFLAYTQTRTGMSPEYLSRDGIHWTEAEGKEHGDFIDSRQATLAPYHFTLLPDNQLSYTRGGMVYTQLPGLMELAQRWDLDFWCVRAYPVGEDMVAVVAYASYDDVGEYPYMEIFTRDSLDAVQRAAWMEAAETVQLEEWTTDGVTTVARRPDGYGYAWTQDGKLWTPCEIPQPYGFWSSSRLLPYDGACFVVEGEDSRWTSADGIHWTGPAARGEEEMQ